MIVYLRKNALYFAWVIALIGVGISLFYGEVLQHEPCPLCWYQRIALFPLALFLGIANIRKDEGIVPYAISLTLFGFAVAVYQIFEIHFPFLRVGKVCRFGEDCASRDFSLFGSFTLPMLSAMGFAAILFLLAFSRRQNRTKR